MLEIGSRAPKFTLPDQNGNLHSLKDYLGKKVILYFYPKDNTPGCTRQACAFAAAYEGFKERLANDPIYSEKLAVATRASRPELAKEFAIQDFVEHIFHMLRRSGRLDRAVSIGFSDDDAGNVQAVTRFIQAELSRRYDGIKFVVYDTSDRTLTKGRKVCVSGQLNLPGF